MNATSLLTNTARAGGDINTVVLCPYGTTENRRLIGRPGRVVGDFRLCWVITGKKRKNAQNPVKYFFVIFDEKC
jgi:hypothetical protein